MTDETTLLPCPFCGGEAELYRTCEMAIVECKRRHVHTKGYVSEAEAIAAWNTRAGAYCAYAQPTDLTDGCELAQRIQALEREIATLKEHRAGNMAKIRELTDECAELRKYRDEWKGLAEKYRADSIAAQEETERYREKLGYVLDALHEAERAAR